MNSNRRNRPNRQPRQNLNSNNTSNTSSSLSTSRSPRTNPNSHPNTVPPHHALHPSTPVSIILKQDQPTGHQVRGIIDSILTRGSHPRGVKVRLRDGRVGRVQRIVSVAEGEEGERIVGGAGAGLGRDGGFGRVERDVREDGYLYDEGRGGRVDDGLFRELEEADRRWEEERGGKTGGAESEVVKCPVCGVFEGDERAVEFHVEGHFGG